MNPLSLPDPCAIFPNESQNEMCYIKNTVKSPHILVGDYTYYSDIIDSTRFEQHCVAFLTEALGDKLIIGKFCSLAQNIKFIMNGANHRMHGVSAYPFSAMGGTWSEIIEHYLEEVPFKGDTVVGNDVWIGMNSTILPGIHIGDGAIIGANAVVTRDVAPYTIVGGNPAKLIRSRFDEELIQLLLQFKWWDLPIEEITAVLPTLCCRDTEEIRSFLKGRLEKL